MDTAHSSKLTFMVNQLFLGVVVNYRIIAGVFIPTITFCNLIPLLLSSKVVYSLKACAIFERLIANTRHAVWHDDFSYQPILEGVATDRSNTVRNRQFGYGAVCEGIITNVS